MINFKGGKRTLIVMDKEDWRMLVTNSRNVKLGADSQIVVLARHHIQMITDRVAEIMAEKAQATNDEEVIQALRRKRQRLKTEKRGDVKRKSLGW